MSNTFKQLIAIIITITAIGMFYFGSFLPLRKSQLYVDALRSASSARSIGDINNLFGKVFDFNSPVGRDEITSAYIGNMLNIISGQSDKRVVDALTSEAERRLEPILEKGNGFNYGQSVYAMGLIYQVSAKKFNDENYYQKAIETFEKGLEYSSNRSAYLYGLFEVHKNKGDIAKAKEIGSTILKYWPNDEEVRKFMEL